MGKNALNLRINGDTAKLILIENSFGEKRTLKRELSPALFFFVKNLTIEKVSRVFIKK